MLRLDFINVGDGDAILVREFRRHKPVFTLLVDCGRQDVGPFPGSRRGSAADYLRDQAVKSIDLLVITHLHPDHFGGMALLQEMAIGRVISLYFPDSGVESLPGSPPPGSSRSTLGMYASLSQFIGIARGLRQSGCPLETAGSPRSLPLTDRLMMRISCPDRALIARQREIFRALESGTELPEEVLYAVSKERNASSLRIALEYAGRRILLPGDAYGAYWDRMPDALPCDILKLPHHGDEKSLTAALMRRLRPGHAVITGLIGDSGKHRPARESLGLLKRWKVRVACLENEAMKGLPRASFRAAVFYIRPGGSIRRRMIR